MHWGCSHPSSREYLAAVESFREDIMKPIILPSAVKRIRTLSPGTIKNALTGVGPKSVLDALKDAQGEAKGVLEGDYTLQLEIEAVRILSVDFPGINEAKHQEIYVVGWMVDGVGNKHVHTTEVKPGYRVGDLVPFETKGQGSPVAILHNPKNWVQWGFSVWESDEKARSVAQMIGSVINSPEIKGAINGIVSATGSNPTVAAIVAAAHAVGSAVCSILAQNGDDRMMTQEGGASAQQLFNAHDPNDDDTIENHYARVRYAVHLYR